MTWKGGVSLAKQRKSPKRRAKIRIHKVGVPLERIAINILGPLPETERGNKYIMVMADYFTKWKESYPVPYKEAMMIAGALIDNFICCFRVPKCIHTDQGRNSESVLFKEVCSLLV